VRVIQYGVDIMNLVVNARKQPSIRPVVVGAFSLISMGFSEELEALPRGRSRELFVARKAPI
jgi:hypothetical protein